MLHGLVYPAVISGRKRKRSWQRKKSWQWGRTQHETEVIQLSMNMENKSISVTCKTRKDKDSKGCFSYFCDVVKEGGTGWNWAGQRCPRGSRVWPTEKLWALISLQSLCVGHKHVKKLSVEQRCSNILSQCASEWNPKERVGKTGFVHLRIVWPWFGNNLDLISKCLKCELGFINWKIWKLSRVSGGKWKCAGQDRCYLTWPDMLLVTANPVVYLFILAKQGSMCSLKRWSGKFDAFGPSCSTANL